MSDNSFDLNEAAPSEPVFEINSSRGFTEWLGQHNKSLAFTTYQVGKLFFVGVKPDGKLWVFNRNIGRCLGLAIDGDELWVTGDTQIFKLVNALENGQRSSDGSDALYVPKLSYFTGDVDCHDIAMMGDGRLAFVNTLFNCLSTVSTTHSFTPLWKPAFISRLAAEDRCHLNGLALVDGALGYATAISQSDTFDGWRDQRRDGGVVIDVQSGEIVCDGLSMPHSPRWHRGRLWLHNSGKGEFGYIDMARGTFEPVCFCPGYLRGLSFIGQYAVMGLSKPRDNKTFNGLALDNELTRRKMQARCGLYVTDLETGDVVHSLTIEGVVSELYDVAVINGKQQPSGLGPTSAQIKKMFSIGP